VYDAGHLRVQSAEVGIVAFMLEHDGVTIVGIERR